MSCYAFGADGVELVNEETLSASLAVVSSAVALRVVAVSEAQTARRAFRFAHLCRFRRFRFA